MTWIKSPGKYLPVLTNTLLSGLCSSLILIPVTLRPRAYLRIPSPMPSKFRLVDKCWRHEPGNFNYGRFGGHNSPPGIPLGGSPDCALTPTDYADMDRKLHVQEHPRVTESRAAPAERTVGMKCPNHNSNASEEMTVRSCWGRTRTFMVALNLECSPFRSTWSLIMGLQYKFKQEVRLLRIQKCHLLVLIHPRICSQRMMKSLRWKNISHKRAEGLFELE